MDIVMDKHVLRYPASENHFFSGLSICVCVCVSVWLSLCVCLSECVSVCSLLAQLKNKLQQKFQICYSAFLYIDTTWNFL